jgi:hypothetical protein
LLVSVCAGAVAALAMPIVAAVIVPGGRVRDLVAVSPQGSTIYAIAVWLALFALAGPRAWPSPWDRRRLRLLPLDRREVITFSLLQSITPVAAFLAMTALLNARLNGNVPHWLGWPLVIFICGISALAGAVLGSSDNDPPFLGAGLWYFLGGLMLGVFRSTPSERWMQRGAFVIGLTCTAAAAIIQHRRLQRPRSTTQPFRSRFASAIRR